MESKWLAALPHFSGTGQRRPPSSLLHTMVLSFLLILGGQLRFEQGRQVLTAAGIFPRSYPCTLRASHVPLATLLPQGALQLSAAVTGTSDMGVYAKPNLHSPLLPRR
jgi:hypothetical protein